MDLDLLYSDFLSNELFEKLENKGYDIDKFEELDIMYNLYSNRNFIKAEKLCSFDLDFWWDDVFISSEETNEDILNKAEELVQKAWEEVKSEKYFKSVVLQKLDKNTLDILSEIY